MFSDARRAIDTEFDNLGLPACFPGPDPLLLLQVSTEEAREKLTSEAARLEDWLYEDGESEVAATYRSKLEELKALTDPILLRAKELEARPAAVEAVVAKLAELTKVMQTPV